MPGVTEQEIAQAKQMNLYQYMQLCEPDNFKPEGPGQFRHKGHSSLTFAADGSWTYFKTKATGRTALNYLIEVEGVSFVEAVREINRIQGGVRPSFQPVKTPPPPAEKKPAKDFKLPRPDKNNYAATAYLRKRCIHPNVLTFCKQKRILYQTSFKDHPNCVFVGRDGSGEPKGGSLRGCSQIQFRRDIPGSKKIYPFYIEAAAAADTVEVYEAPIDAMSGASLKIMQHTGNWRGVHYLALGGTDYAALDAQIPQMAKKLVEVIGVDRVRPHTYTQRDGYTWVQVEKDMHITEWLYAHELCSSLQFTRFLNRDGRELFQVRDGQRVIETNADGTKRIRAVKSIDVTHAYVGHYGCHIQQYAEDNFRTGCYVAPEHPQSGDNLDKLQIYQITKGGCEYRFMNYAYSKSRIHAADYSSVYIANLPADYDLDRCFQEFNAPNRPLRYHMCSLSTSDIVVTTKNGKETAYYVDSIGFKDVSHLLPELHEVEAQRQKEQVQDEPGR